MNPDIQEIEEFEKIRKKNLADKLDKEEIVKLKRLIETTIKIYRKKWNRWVPFGEAILDRWCSAENLNFGKGSNISGTSYVFGDVKIGKNCYMGPYTILEGVGGLEIGDFCSVGAGSQIYTHNTIERTLSGHKKELVRSQTKIGDNCYIGPNSIITMGVTLGKSVLVGANTTINFNVEDFKIVSGNPAKIIGEI